MLLELVFTNVSLQDRNRLLEYRVPMEFWYLLTLRKFMKLGGHLKLLIITTYWLLFINNFMRILTYNSKIKLIYTISYNIFRFRRRILPLIMNLIRVLIFGSGICRPMLLLELNPSHPRGDRWQRFCGSWCSGKAKSRKPLLNPA